jgi:hypothetical protein
MYFFSILFYMWLRYKLLLVPLVVIFLGGLSVFCEKTVKLEQITFSKGLPFLPSQAPKTELTQSTWSNKASLSNTLFLCAVTNIKIIRPYVSNNLINEKELFYSSYFFNDCQGRSPPSLT